MKRTLACFFLLVLPVGTVIITLWSSYEFVLGRMLAAVKEGSKLTLFEGLPHQSFEKDLLETEVDSKNTELRFGAYFYVAANPVSIEDAAVLRRILSTSETFTGYPQPKLCGAFHPDYALLWDDAVHEVEFHICFGCHEMKIFSDGKKRYCDIDALTFIKLKELLSEYRVQRPERTVEQYEFDEMLDLQP